MSRSRGTASVVASPVLVGAVTTLIVLVAVFLAYNANQGLPFVPTYDLTAQVPNGSNLVVGDDVRIGGFRVGVVNNMRPKVVSVNGHTLTIALLDMKLDKQAEPLARDTTLIIRARSSLGLKYVELTPGTSSTTYKAGATIPLRYASLPVEFDDFLNTFDQPTRVGSQQALTGYGDAFAGRGANLNQAIAGFVPFFTFLQPVMANLSDPRTALNQFFKQIGATSAQIAPVARIQADVFTNMANTFQAINSTEGQCAGGSCLQQTIEKGPPTQDTAIASFRVQRPFLVDFTDLSRRLIPSVTVLPTALPRIDSALRIGTPVVRSSATLNDNTARLFDSLDALAKDPNTLLSLQDLRDTFGVASPLLGYIAPFQTVCNYTNYFFNGLGSHQSELVTGGTAERILIKTDNNPSQQNRFGENFAYRPVDIPANESVHTAKDPVTGGPLQSLHGAYYTPAIDAQGNANCQTGQFGYVEGPITPGGRYAPSTVQDPTSPSQLQSFGMNAAGGSHVISSAYPRLEGPTFTGYPNLKSVP